MGKTQFIFHLSIFFSEKYLFKQGLSCGMYSTIQGNYVDLLKHDKIIGKKWWKFGRISFHLGSCAVYYNCFCVYAFADT